MRIVVVTSSGTNFSSIKYAFERLGVVAIFTKDPKKIINATHVVLPGVGAAQQAMKKLTADGLLETITTLKQPVLGICLGMQLFFDYSSEGNVPCLGVISGKIERILNKQLPVPHMGWNKIKSDHRNSLFQDIAASYFYFAHSYFAAITPYTIAQVNYEEIFSAAVQKENFFGVQFHPERSGRVGLKLLRNFIGLT